MCTCVHFLLSKKLWYQCGTIALIVMLGCGCCYCCCGPNVKASRARQGDLHNVEVDELRRHATTPTTFGATHFMKFNLETEQGILFKFYHQFLSLFM